MCVLGLQLSALEMHSVMQLCCYFVVCSFVHSFSTHLTDTSGRSVECTQEPGVGEGSCSEGCSCRGMHVGAYVMTLFFLFPSITAVHRFIHRFQMMTRPVENFWDVPTQKSNSKKH